MKVCERCGYALTPNGPYCLSCWRCEVHYAVVALDEEGTFVQIMAPESWQGLSKYFKVGNYVGVHH